jgi:hypothetical protein
LIHGTHDTATKHAQGGDSGGTESL